MKKFISIFLLISASTIVKAQDNAFDDSLRIAGNYQLELKHRLQTLKSNLTSWSVHYNIACCYALLKKNDSAFYYLNKSIEFGQNDGWALADFDLKALHTDDRWKTLQKRLEEIYKQKHPQIDTELGWEISKMYFEDQAPKSASDNIALKYGMKSLQMELIDSVIATTDSLNMLRLDKIIEIHGWPGKKLIGMDGSNMAFIIILHAPLRYQKKYFEMVKVAVNNGDLNRSSLAYLIDKMLTKEGKDQLYGTQLKYSYENKKYEFKPIEDEKNVNKRRSEVGLGPIEDYAKNFGFIYISK
ncbi:MAG TPA: DUF6624 domain-containing protein [Bacteroidia bacterium]|jgi:adenylate kinase family enzyme|nr:DUF6624 domain-containing protein [Bacteroidia bacterium]